MDFAWSEQDQELIDAAEEFASSTLSNRKKLDCLDSEAWELSSQYGILKTPLPESWGGLGKSALSTVAVFEALGRGGADRGLLFALGAHLYGVAVPVAKYANNALQERWGKSLADGSAIGALVMTEPGGGSTLDTMKTFAEKNDDGYIINGEKVFITNGPDADVLLLIASESQNPGVFGLTAFLIPSNHPGITIERMEPTMGLRSAPMGRVSFNQCAVPKEMVLGRPKLGLKVFNTAMQWERPCIMAGALGSGFRDIDIAMRYLQERNDGKSSLFSHQGASHRIANMHTRLESSRLLVYRAAWSIDHNEDAFLHPCMAKYSASETFATNALELMRLYGGWGWLNENGVADGMTDIIGGLSASGASDVQLNLIAGALAKRKKG